jgi:hypothetical protein
MVYWRSYIDARGTVPGNRIQAGYTVTIDRPITDDGAIVVTIVNPIATQTEIAEGKNRCQCNLSQITSGITGKHTIFLNFSSNVLFTPENLLPFSLGSLWLYTDNYTMDKVEVDNLFSFDAPKANTENDSKSISNMGINWESDFTKIAKAENSIAPRSDIEDIITGFNDGTVISTSEKFDLSSYSKFLVYVDAYGNSIGENLKSGFIVTIDKPLSDGGNIVATVNPVVEQLGYPAYGLNRCFPNMADMDKTVATGVHTIYFNFFADTVAAQTNISTTPIPASTSTPANSGQDINVKTVIYVLIGLGAVIVVAAIIIVIVKLRKK